AAARAAAQGQGIVHRDIKPENIRIGGDGYVKLLDFGLAKLIERGGELGKNALPHSPPPFSTPGMVMGTFAYMSPEQAQGRETDGRSDIFSLGAVLYEMITGRGPFDGSSPVEVMAAILNREAWPLARYAKETPADLERIVRKAMAKGRQERYPTSNDLLIDLKTLKLDLEIAIRIRQAGQREAQA